MSIRWSECLASEIDASDYDCPVGALLLWAGEADDAGHVEADAVRFLTEHDGHMNEHHVLLYGPETEKRVKAALAEMSEELGFKPGYLH